MINLNFRISVIGEWTYGLGLQSGRPIKNLHIPTSAKSEIGTRF